MNLSRMSKPPLQNAFAAGIVPAALWLWLFFHLHVEWTLNPQYNYGWAVPFLCAFLIWKKSHRGARDGEPREVSDPASIASGSLSAFQCFSVPAFCLLLSALQRGYGSIFEDVNAFGNLRAISFATN